MPTSLNPSEPGSLPGKTPVGQAVVQVSFYSYFKDLAGCAQTTETVPAGSTMGDLLKALMSKFPRLAGMQNSTLIAVGVEYQDRRYTLKNGDEVSLFPPVQGG